MDAQRKSSSRRLPAGRKADLAAYVEEVGQVTVADLSAHFGVSIDTISRYLGHASIQTTIAYFDPEDTSATAVLRDLDYG